MLLMKYHPAKKEVKFGRYRDRDGIEVQITDESKLKYYMNKKGSFVLQDYGNDFLSDISSEFDGLDVVEVRAITTTGAICAALFQSAWHKYNVMNLSGAILSLSQISNQTESTKRPTVANA